MKPRILVIRGGAIGDFILTLPALRLLRESFPEAHLEILGYKHIVALAEGRFYADSTRSIEYARLARFFVPGAELDPELIEYFGAFQQIISYIYDPDGLFDLGLRRAGAKNILHANSRLDDSDHAARQLARPLEVLALYLEDPAAQFFASASDTAFADRFLKGVTRPVIAIHPGSGSPAKNWPVESWCQLVRQLAGDLPSATFLLVGGEADQPQLATLRVAWRDLHVLEAKDLPLFQLGAVLGRCDLFLGHDSGISHLAAASGSPSLLLFGPTDPDIWAPRNPPVRVRCAPGGDFAALDVPTVLGWTREILNWEGRLQSPPSGD